MSSSPPLIELRNVSKVFVNRSLRQRSVVYALREVSLTIARGEVLALVGESGSGKSTTAQLLARLTHPSGGEIWFDGRAINRQAGARELRQYRRRVQMIFQDPFSSLNAVHTVGYHVGRPLAIHRLVPPGRALAAQVETLLETVGLHPGREFVSKFPHQLSGGQRQRVGIARALAPNPDVLIADEPTSMLDVSLRLDVMNLLLDLRTTRKVSMLYITHDLSGANYMADRIAVMYRGTIMEEAPSDVLMKDPVHPYTRLLLDASTADFGNGPSVAGPLGALDPSSPGCPFYPRCPSRMPVCSETRPVSAWIADEAEHRVSCHRYHDAESPKTGRDAQPKV